MNQNDEGKNWRTENDSQVRLICDELFQKFCTDSALFVQEVEQKYGALFAMNVLNNLLMATTAWHWGTCMTFLSGLPKEKTDRYRNAKTQEIIKVFLSGWDDGE